MSFIMNNPRFVAFDANGVPLTGGKLYTYESGTTTPKTTYADQALTTPNTNPIVLDSRGEASIWGSGEYKIVLKDANDVQLWVMDEVTWYDLSTTIPTFPLSVTLGGTEASTASAARANLGVEIGVDVEAYDANTLKANLADNLEKGFSNTVYDVGSKSSGIFTPLFSNGNSQKVTNAGAHGIAPSGVDTNFTIKYVNASNAGLLSSSSFTAVDGDTYLSNSGYKFFLYITEIDGDSHLTIKALQ